MAWSSTEAVHLISELLAPPGPKVLPAPAHAVAALLDLLKLAHPTPAPSLAIGGAPVPVLFAGLTPDLAGLYQINNSTVLPVAVVQ